MDISVQNVAWETGGSREPGANRATPETNCLMAAKSANSVNGNIDCSVVEFPTMLVICTVCMHVCVCSSIGVLFPRWVGLFHSFSYITHFDW